MAKYFGDRTELVRFQKYTRPTVAGGKYKQKSALSKVYFKRLRSNLYPASYLCGYFKGLYQYILEEELLLSGLVDLQ